MNTTGALRLLRFGLRRDRLMLLWWVAGGVLLYWSQAVSVKGLYPTQAEFDRAAATMADNAAFIAMAGPPRALDTVGGQVAWQASAYGAILAGLMSMFLVGRHTRAEEESGRDELIRAGAVGRLAPTAAAALLVLIADVLFGGLVALSLVAYGLPVAGSVNVGLAATMSGLVFGAVALAAAQLSEGTRTMYGVTGAVIAASYVVRAIGDVNASGLSWASPIGWGQQMHPFSGDRWWPVLISVAAIAGLLPLALRLFSERDNGAGLLPARPGPARAGRSLLHPLGLAWRLQRATVVGWTIGMFLLGVGYGTIGDDVQDVIGDSQLSQDIFRQGVGSVVDSFYAVAVLMLALIASGFAIASMLRPRSEEERGRAEPLLATALSRTQWLVTQAAITLLGVVATVSAAGLGIGIGFALVTGDGAAISRLLAATVPYVAPVLVLAACALLVFAVQPRWAPVSWLVLAFCAVVMLFGQTLRMPGWLEALSPFSHLAHTPAEAFAWQPVVVLTVLAAALGQLAVAAFRRRDLIG